MPDTHRCVSIRGVAGNYHGVGREYVAAAVYEAHARKRDGVPIWKMIECLKPKYPHRPYMRREMDEAVLEAKEIAEKRGIPFIPNVAQNREVLDA